ncbi:MAG TPA: hypothetical protein VKT82_15475 [Ktedonobacterales bacterium]|nr:hypothetical protein [Ktedonobacterales bacterium]
MNKRILDALDHARTARRIGTYAGWTEADWRSDEQEARKQLAALEARYRQGESLRRTVRLLSLASLTQWGTCDTRAVQSVPTSPQSVPAYQHTSLKVMPVFATGQQAS